MNIIKRTYNFQTSKFYLTRSMTPFQCKCQFQLNANFVYWFYCKRNTCILPPPREFYFHLHGELPLHLLGRKQTCFLWTLLTKEVVLSVCLLLSAKYPTQNTGTTGTYGLLIIPIGKATTQFLLSSASSHQKGKEWRRQKKVPERPGSKSSKHVFLVKGRQLQSSSL